MRTQTKRDARRRRRRKEADTTTHAGNAQDADSTSVTSITIDKCDMTSVCVDADVKLAD